MPHQVSAVHAIAALRYRAILADDMGLGKTSTSLWACEDAGVSAILVLCPNTIVEKWRDEINVCLPAFDVILCRGNKFERLRALREATSHGGEVALVMGYGTLPHVDEDWLRSLSKDLIGGQALICDESFYLKNPKAIRTKAVLKHLAPHLSGPAVRLCLAGTPVRNQLDDLWSQVEIVQPGIWHGFEDFRERYLSRKVLMVKYQRNGRMVERAVEQWRGSRNDTELNAITNTVMIRRKKGDVLNLPEKVLTEVPITLDEASRKVYRQLVEEALIALQEFDDDKPIFDTEVGSAVARVLRCEQVCQGFIGGLAEGPIQAHAKLGSQKIQGRPHELAFSRNSKVQWVREQIDTILGQGNKLVVFSRFNGILEWFHQTYKNSALLTGQVPVAERAGVLRRFEDDADILLVNIKIAEGWDATCAQDAIFLGRDWTPAYNAQAEDRLHRIGQHGTVNIQVPIVQDSVEQRIAERLAAKHVTAARAIAFRTVREVREILS